MNLSTTQLLRPHILSLTLTTLLPTGSRQEAYPSHSQAPACHCRCLARCDQGAPFPATRGSCRCPQRRRQGGQGEEGRRRVAEEGREGQERLQRRTRPSRKGQQAGCQGRSTKGAGKDSLRLWTRCAWLGVMAGDFRDDSGVPLTLSDLLQISCGEMESRENGMMAYIFLAQ